MINIYNIKWLPWRWHSIAICPFIFYYYARDDVSPWLRRHEEYHWHHQLRWLVIPWFIIYGLMWLHYGYKKHPWERAANNAAREEV